MLFDKSTRMIVRHSGDGAKTWSPSWRAPDSVRQTTERVFNTLFQETLVSVEAKALKTDDLMQKLQDIISTKTGDPVHDVRNIAFAEIRTNTGKAEVYVSVSGRQGDTGFLPLFGQNKNRNPVMLGDTAYFNIDHGAPSSRTLLSAPYSTTSLSVSDSGKLRAIPHTIDNIESYKPALTSRPTSLDTESKLIRAIRSKYPDAKELDSITIATTMAPCDSCAVVMKQFGYEGGPGMLNVIWK